MMKMRPTFFLALLLVACDAQHAGHDHVDSTTTTQAVADKYTCPMHPQITQDAPGTCPICGMDLVKVSSVSNGENALMLTDAQMKLANITTGSVSRRSIGQTAIINGTLTVDQEKTEVISSRVGGRIEKLFIRETGVPVKKGQPLYQLYSEALLTLQQEYLLAKEQYELLGKTESRYRSFLEAAKRKLVLYGLTGNQIAGLGGSRSLQPRITFLSPASGIVTDIPAAEGAYVDEGENLYRIDDIRSLWVEAELYPHEVNLVEPGDTITVRVSGVGLAPVLAKVTFLSPEVRGNSQIVVMRAEIPNTAGTLRPGQQAQVFLTHAARTALALPGDAVIRDERGAHVYVQSGHNTFNPRMVRTGQEGFDYVEITEGLQEGDTVAMSGAYLLYSELILKRGSDPMAGHAH